MAIDPYESEEVELYDITPMTPIGLMDGDCELLELPQGLDKIKATMNGKESSVSIVYKIFNSNLRQIYGDITDERIVWTFTEDNPLVGLYGRQTEDGIA